MMKMQNALNKLVKAGWSVSQPRFTTRNRITGETMTPNLHTAKHPEKKDRIDFHDQNGETICIRVVPENDEDDYQADYFAGVYVDNITQALNIAD